MKNLILFKLKSISTSNTQTIKCISTTPITFCLDHTMHIAAVVLMTLGADRALSKSASRERERCCWKASKKCKQCFHIQNQLSAAAMCCCAARYKSLLELARGAHIKNKRQKGRKKKSRRVFGWALGGVKSSPWSNVDQNRYLHEPPWDRCIKNSNQCQIQFGLFGFDECRGGALSSQQPFSVCAERVVKQKGDGTWRIIIKILTINLF